MEIAQPKKKRERKILTLKEQFMCRELKSNFSLSRELNKSTSREEKKIIKLNKILKISEMCESEKIKSF